MGSGLLLMASIKLIVRPPSPSIENVFFVSAFYQQQVLGIRCKKLVVNTQKGHVVQSDLCTASLLPETLTTTCLSQGTIHQEISMVLRKGSSTVPFDRQTWSPVQETNLV